MNVRWGVDNSYFQLTAPDAQVLESARQVFHPWMTATTGPVEHHWRVKHGTHAPWELWSNGDQVAAGELTQMLLAAEYAAVQHFVESPGRLTLHAALVARGEAGLMIAGPCEAGKTTLAVALWQRGWSLICDDVVLIDPVTLRGAATPRRVSLRDAAVSHFDTHLQHLIRSSPGCDRSAKGIVFHPHEVDGRPRINSSRIDAILFLARNRSHAKPGELQRIPPAQALLELLPYSSLSRHEAFWRAIQRLEPVAAKVPMFDLARDDLASMTGLIEERIGVPTSPASEVRVSP